MTETNAIRRAMAIFDAVCDLPDEQRATALDRACNGNATMRARVERMLAADENELAMLADSKPGAGAEILSDELCDASESPVLPKRIDRYRIIRELGRGGMGVVYEAEQENPRRRVALKVIRRAFASAGLVRRFRQEAHVLGQLRHPGIAQIIEAGSARIAESDLPYYTMELIDGVPLDESAESLGVRDRVELMARVCDAVQHAHQRGIIHRDLKPANIQVVQESTSATSISFGGSTGQTLIDAIGQPKILDFGIARLVDADHQVTTVQTHAGQIVGTLAYMSPEQVEGNSALLDTRCDVYALGVLLYQILSGRLPHDLSGKPVAEAARIIREVEPPRLSSIDGAPRGDLDTIVTKAIEKDPDRRYQSAEEMSADLRRYLRDQPILARPISTFYQLRKFARRNKGLVGGFAFAMIAIIAGSVVAGYYAIHEHQQRRIADEQHRLADERYEEVIRLADLKRLNDAIAQADALWPELPQTIPAMEKWQTELAEPLAANLEQHKKALEKLRALATPIKNEKGIVTEWKMPDDELQWRHDTLTDLVRRLDTFCNSPKGAQAQIRKRLDYANKVKAYTLESPSAVNAWKLAAEDVRKSDIYHGLKLAPQAGLLPLRTDEQTGLLECLYARTGQVPTDRPGTNRPDVQPDSGIVMVLLPGGTVRMGAQHDDSGAAHFDPNADDNEAPVHEVRLAPFFISKFELTQRQWWVLSGERPSGYSKYSTDELKTGDNHPVEQVTWEDAMKYLPRYGLTLPTEAQWEYAARGSTTTPWSSGDDATSVDGFADLADMMLKRYRRDETRCENRLDDGFIVHAPVGSFAPNPFGLYDMMGNVAEWCRDQLAPYSNGVSGDDALRDTNGNDRVMVRGGSWEDLASDARSAARHHLPPDTRRTNIGIRPVRAVNR